jgi:hypothetical protein
MTRTMTRPTRNGEHDRTECAAQRLGLMRQVDDGTATPRVVGPARGRGQRLGAGVNAAGREVLPEWNPADRVGLNQCMRIGLVYKSLTPVKKTLSAFSVVASTETV